MTAPIQAMDAGRLPTNEQEPRHDAGQHPGLSEGRGIELRDRCSDSGLEATIALLGPFSLPRGSRIIQAGSTLHSCMQG